MVVPEAKKMTRVMTREEEHAQQCARERSVAPGDRLQISGGSADIRAGDQRQDATPTGRTLPQRSSRSRTGMRHLEAMPQGIVREETCAVRQDAFCKVHDNFVTAKKPFSAKNTGQIIYILKRLVTKKNVTVAFNPASPAGDNHPAAIRSGRDSQGHLRFSKRAFQKKLRILKT